MSRRWRPAARLTSICMHSRDINAKTRDTVIQRVAMVWKVIKRFVEVVGSFPCMWANLKFCGGIG